MQDVYDYYPRPDGVSIGFLPTYVGGYEKLFERLESSIAWSKPAYDMLTAAGMSLRLRRACLQRQNTQIGIWGRSPDSQPAGLSRAQSTARGTRGRPSSASRVARSQLPQFAAAS